MEGTLSPADVAVLSGNNSRNNDGFGDGNGWWIVLFLIVLFGGWGNRGFGGFGGNGTDGSSISENYVLTSDFSQLSRQISDGFNSQERKLDGINNGLCDGFYAQNTNLLNGFSGVNQNIAAGVSGIQNTLTQGFAGLNTGMVQQGYENRIAVNGVGTQLAQCCCDIRQQISDTSCATNRNIDAVNYNMATNTNAINNTINSGFVGVQQAMCLNTRDILDNQNNNTRQILDAITANRIEDLKEANRRLESKNSSLELAASQAAQNEYLLNSLRNGCPVNAQLVCGNQPIPVNYIAANGCNCNTGCGCNC